MSTSSSPTYDSIVIGSGFGGAVSACRLTQAGFKVALLERGRRYGTGTGSVPFPRAPTDEWLWSISNGLLDVRLLSEMAFVQSSGYGGGSLIYANVHLRPPAEFISPQYGWPKEYSRAMLDPYYDLVAHMLDVKPITTVTQNAVGPRGPSEPHELPLKTQLMTKIASQLQRGAQLCYPDLAITFGDPDKAIPNQFGVPQRGCNFCGECVIGCPSQSKNTLDHNYLKVAEDHGAQIHTQCEVTKIVPLDGKSGETGYRVVYLDHARDGAEQSMTAKTVFLCAGAINSTELLLRCRDLHDRPLAHISQKLGHGYSGNGDFLCFAVETLVPFAADKGPTITTGLVFDRQINDQKVWFILEEGGYPRQVAALIDALIPSDLSVSASLLFNLGQNKLRQSIASSRRSHIWKTKEVPHNIAVFLGMGMDSSDGTIRLLPLVHELYVDWHNRPNQDLSDIQEGLARDIATAMGGEYESTPLWRTLRQPITVHSLGGCGMADSPDAGVTAPSGQVYGYPGLYVLDGAILPRATGVNPASTIAAVAERNIEQFIRSHPGQQQWQAPQRLKAPRRTDLLAQLVMPHEPLPLPRSLRQVSNPGSAEDDESPPFG